MNILNIDKIHILSIYIIHLVQIHGFCFIIEFIALILLLLYVFDYYFNIFFHILLSKFVVIIPNMFELPIFNLSINSWLVYNLAFIKTILLFSGRLGNEISIIQVFSILYSFYLHHFYQVYSDS